MESEAWVQDLHESKAMVVADKSNTQSYKM